jgi:hypothetical protein
MKKVSYFIAAASIFAYAASASAATVTSIEGALQVNTGTGFHKVSGSAQVAPGGSVMVGPGGKAEIVYSDGCKIPVRPGAIGVVAPVSPCAQGADLGVPYAPVATYNYGSWLGYGLALGAGIGIGAAIWSNQHHNTVVYVPTPVSP